MKNKKNESAIDLTYLKQVSNGDDRFMKEMINVYLKETPEAIKNLEKYLKNNEWKKFRALTHKMKPSFSFFGLKKLDTVINKMEEYSGKGILLDELPGLLEKVKSACEEAMTELKSSKYL